MKRILATILILITIAAQAQWYDFIGQLQFDPNSPNPPFSEGMMFYDNDAKSVAYYSDISDVAINVGQKDVVRARNTTGGTLTKGTVVYVSGTTGQTPEITSADNSFVETSLIIGVVAADILNSDFGLVVTAGNITDLNTVAFSDGDAVYLNASGGLTNVLPDPPAIIQRIGIILNSHASQGKLLVDSELLPRIPVSAKNFVAEVDRDAQFISVTSRFTTGNNPTFDNGGSLTGTFAQTTTAGDQLEGTRAYRYSNVTNNDWIAYYPTPIPNAITKKAIDINYTIRYKYTGVNGDVEARIKCVTSGGLLVGVGAVPLNTTDNKLTGVVTVPLNCTSILFGFQAVATNAGGILIFDELVINDTVVDHAIPEIGYVEDIRTSGTSGGGCTSGSYQTRTLNTTDGDFLSFGSLASNQFTLQGGTYHIEASAAAYLLDANRLRIQNITDATTAILGQNSFARVTSVMFSNALLKGTITIATTKTFELQHRCTTTRTTDGFGVSAAFGDSEVYAQIKIIKLK